jgi:hypothetical protein
MARGRTPPRPHHALTNPRSPRCTHKPLPTLRAHKSPPSDSQMTSRSVATTLGSVTAPTGSAGRFRRPARESLSFPPPWSCERATKHEFLLTHAWGMDLGHGLLFSSPRAKGTHKRPPRRHHTPQANTSRTSHASKPRPMYVTIPVTDRVTLSVKPV